MDPVPSIQMTPGTPTPQPPEEAHTRQPRGRSGHQKGTDMLVIAIYIAVLGTIALWALEQ